MPVFYIRQGSRAGEEVRLNASRIIIGRSPDNLLVLPDASVDLAHASLEDRGNYWILQALGSPEGIWLNDDIVDKPCRVFDGDVIRLGNIRIEVQEVGSPDGEPSSIISITSFARSQERSLLGGASSSKHFFAYVGLGGLIIILVLVAVGLLIGARLFISNVPRENTPPLVGLLTEEREFVVSPKEKVVFISEAQDPEDLARVEFWVDDVLQDVNRPNMANVVKMQTLHQWSTDQPGDYVLSIIAYDKQGQPSEMIKVRVTVREP
jgi:hypothetical protein